MQLPRDVQPLLVGAAPRCLFAGALRLIRAPLGLPQRFPRRTGRDQPGESERNPGIRERVAHGPVGVRDQHRERKRRHHEHRTRHRDEVVSCPYCRIHRDQVRDRGCLETDRLVTQCTQPGHAQHDYRSAACRTERGRRSATTIGGLFAATADGGPDTGNGIVAAFAAVVSGLIGVILGGLTLNRSHRVSRTV